MIILDFHGMNLKMKVLDVDVVDFRSMNRQGGEDAGMVGGSRDDQRKPYRGILMQQTAISIVRAPESTLRLVGAKKGYRFIHSRPHPETLIYSILLYPRHGH